MELTERVSDQIGSPSICEISSVTGCSRTDVIRIYDFIKSEIVPPSANYYSPASTSVSHNSSFHLARILSQQSNTTENYLFGSKSLEIMQKTEILQRYTAYQVLHQLLNRCNKNSNFIAPVENVKSNVNQKSFVPEVPSLDRLNTSQTSSRGSARLNKGCSFCRTNNESYDVYSSHLLFDKYTKILACPILRKLVCPLCGSTGDNAHTLSYCPLNSSKVASKPVSVFRHINSSPRLASGKLRI